MLFLSVGWLVQVASDFQESVFGIIDSELENIKIQV